LRIAVLAAASLFAGAPAHAQNVLPPSPGADGTDIVLELGGGGAVAPAYEGADDYLLSPWPIVSLHYLRLPYFGEFGGGPATGFSFAPSFRYVAKRDADDYDDLEGLDDVDAAFELGATVGYRYDMFRGFATLRQGLGGHHGLIGEIGLDAIAAPTPKLEVSLGPRLGFASEDYLDTYLGVTAAESAASGLREFDPDGGLKGIGIEANLRYALSPRWSLVGNAGYERLIGDAADSPITNVGSENQFTAGLGLTYTFGLDLFR
jgi:outer membrane protein